MAKIKAAVAGANPAGGNAGDAIEMQAKYQRLLDAVHGGNLGSFKAAAAELTPSQVSGMRDNHGRCVLHHAAQAGHLDLCEHLAGALGFDVDTQDGSGETPLTLACATGKTAAARFLLGKGADVNLCSDTGGAAPLHRAANAASSETIELLVAAGADVNMPSRTGTPLCWAAGAGKATGVSVLLKAGANPNPAGGHHPLLVAAASGNDQAVTELLAAGADAKYTGAHGSSALHGVAAVREIPEPAAAAITTALLQAGADADITDEGGLTPLAMAAALGNAPLVKLLLPATKKEKAGGLEVADAWTEAGVLAAGKVLREKLQAAQGIGGRQPEQSSAPTTGADSNSNDEGITVAVPAPSEPDETKAAEAKRQGDVAFVKGDFQAAVEAYDRSLKHATKTPAVWANRSAARLKSSDPHGALADARVAVALDPSYVKARYRQGSAHAALKQWEDAALAFFEAHNLDPKNAELSDAFHSAIAEGRKEAQAGKA